MGLEVNIGPIALPLHPLIFLLSVAVALAVAQFVSHGEQKLQRALFTSVWVGLLVARLSFVIRFFPDFQDDFLKMFDIRDLGFDLIAGVLGGLCVTARFFFRLPAIRKSLVIAVSSGVLVWGLANAAVELYKTPETIPSIALMNRDGDSQALTKRDGRPTVINLWASWCGPCQSEMPVLARAQIDHPGVHLVFVNQGETAGHVDAYLESQDLHIRNSLLDPAHAVAKAVGAVGFPTTLFYDANGRLLAAHLGPFSKATFNQALSQFYPLAVSKDN
ncbi:Thiol-disulfide oxidoreductase ResA (plasmid) [Caballeronia sp. SBC1]|uniref:TlpA disulfide reductase family protein n=1 Tax=unclassified Caballeronia TaxID=2646786 RepID=UPI0013E151F0|nr:MULTISPECIES: TlpA disulfide reductase family protein [unclassified Caballeronia]QIE26096.1 Thiol-disulfide oxidoreductase ResA [Caballeronia sp. SBC2]QIN64591.1 Thiol-disulfide oxidoreductase ResA [Caballeronia sp. SBC1]